jgi:hypothetical protein
MAKRCGKPPLPKFFSLQLGRDVPSKQLAFTQTYGLEGFNACIQTPVAERIALRADLNAVNDRVDVFGGPTVPADRQ